MAPAARVGGRAAKRPGLRTLLCVEDGTGETPAAGSEPYEEVLQASIPERPQPGERSSDDLYCVYTGGTTGMPKGVIWRHEDIFKAAMGGGDPTQMGNYVTSAADLAARMPPPGLCALATPPLMHASAHWLVFHHLFCGGKAVMLPQ